MIEMETEVRRGCKTIAEAMAIVEEQAKPGYEEYKSDKRRILTFTENLKTLLVDEQMSYQQGEIHQIFWNTAIKIYTASPDSITRTEVITMALLTATTLNQHANYQKKDEVQQQVKKLLSKIDKLKARVSQDLDQQKNS